jgi:HEAT repeat protein
MEYMLDMQQMHQHIQAWDSGNDASRRRILQSLKNLEEKDWAGVPVKGVHALVESFRQHLQSQAFMRQEVVTILGNIGPRSEPTVPILIELLDEGNPDAIREAAATALGKIGAEGKSPDQKVRAALINLWLSPGNTQNSQVRLGKTLCKLRIDAAGLSRFLTSILAANQDASLRTAAAEALAWCNKNEPDVVPALLSAALNDRHEAVRQRAQASLDQLRLSHEKAIALCAKQLKESPYAETALRKSGPLAVPALIEALNDQEPGTREKATRILSGLGEAAVAAVPALTTGLQDRDFELRLAAAKALWNITKKADVVVPVLVTLLEKGWAAPQVANETRRRFLQSVMETLQRIGPPAHAAVSALADKAKDKNRLVSESALTALKVIAPTMTVKVATRK